MHQYVDGWPRKHYLSPEAVHAIVEASGSHTKKRLLSASVAERTVADGRFCRLDAAYLDRRGKDRRLIALSLPKTETLAGLA
jgi:hypothetical protein